MTPDLLLLPDLVTVCATKKIEKLQEIVVCRKSCRFLSK